MPNQYYNSANPSAHYSTTGPELWRQTEGQITHLFVGAGSCGTISGAGKFLKEKNSSIKIIGIDAATSAYSSCCPKPYTTEGMGIDTNDNLDLSAFDEIVPALIDSYKPDVIFAQLGADSLQNDPLSHLMLSNLCFSDILIDNPTNSPHPLFIYYKH